MYARVLSSVNKGVFFSLASRFVRSRLAHSNFGLSSLRSPERVADYRSPLRVIVARFHDRSVVYFVSSTAANIIPLFLYNAIREYNWIFFFLPHCHGPFRRRAFAARLYFSRIFRGFIISSFYRPTDRLLSGRRPPSSRVTDKSFCSFACPFPRGFSRYYFVRFSFWGSRKWLEFRKITSA